MLVGAGCGDEEAPAPSEAAGEDTVLTEADAATEETAAEEPASQALAAVVCGGQMEWSAIAVEDGSEEPLGVDLNCQTRFSTTQLGEHDRPFAGIFVLSPDLVACGLMPTRSPRTER